MKSRIIPLFLGGIIIVNSPILAMASNNQPFEGDITTTQATSTIPKYDYFDGETPTECVYESEPKENIKKFDYFAGETPTECVFSPK